MRSVIMPMEPDYYEILQVSPEAEHEVIGAAYKKLARKYHPDLNPDTTAVRRMRDLNRAIEVLGDPHKRAEYDARRTKSGGQRRRPRLLTGSHTTAPSPRSRRSRIAKPAVLAACAIGAGLALIAIALALNSGSGPSVTDLSATTAPQASPSVNTSASTTTPAVAAVSTAPTPPAPGSGTFSNGTWLVGEEIAPGMWRAIRSRTCSWKRLASIEGATDIVAGSGSHLTVEIRPSDAAFWSEGCGWWTQILTPPSADPSLPFGPGTWLVGEEIATGLWQNSDSSEGCSWARLTRLDGGPSSTNANGFTDSSLVTVQISVTDRAFHSSGCGTWTRLSN